MKHSHLVLAGATLATIVSSAGLRAQAEDANDLDEVQRQGWRLEQEYRLDPDLQRQVEIGLKIAPVPLNLGGKNVVLVGLGSYIVNAQGDCNDCHTNPPYAPGGDPFMGQPKQVNVAGYLAGGQPFGPGIVSRNLTPECPRSRRSRRRSDIESHRANSGGRQWATLTSRFGYLDIA